MMTRNLKNSIIAIEKIIDWKILQKKKIASDEVCALLIKIIFSCTSIRGWRRSQLFVLFILNFMLKIKIFSWFLEIIRNFERKRAVELMCVCVRSFSRPILKRPSLDKCNSDEWIKYTTCLDFKCFHLTRLPPREKGSHVTSFFATHFVSNLNFRIFFLLFYFRNQSQAMCWELVECILKK